MHTKRASTAQSTFFAHHEEEFNLHIGYELVRDRRDDAFLVSGPVGLFKIKWGLPNAHQNLIKIRLLDLDSQKKPYFKTQFPLSSL